MSFLPVFSGSWRESKGPQTSENIHTTQGPSLKVKFYANRIEASRGMCPLMPRTGDQVVKGT